MMNIYQSIAAVINDIGAVGKTSKNQTQGFMYRGIDAVMNALNPAFSKHKIFVVPKVLDYKREERTSSRGGAMFSTLATVEYTFYAEDGTNVVAVVVGEAVDSGDKSFSKALSIAYKYACFQVFCLPTEEMIDPDAESHEIAPKSAEEKTMDEASEKAKKQVIDAAKVMALTKTCEEHSVPIDKVLKLYKVDALEDMTVVKWKHAIDNIEKIKAANV
jgi:hypothetical protein